MLPIDTLKFDSDRIYVTKLLGQTLKESNFILGMIFKWYH